MTRRWVLAYSVVLLLGGSAAASAQQDFSKVEVTSEKIAEGVYMLKGAGGNVIHGGDTFFNGMYPFIDLSSGGSVNGMIAAADRMLALAGDGTKIIPGHGPLGTKADLEAYRDMLATARDRVAALVKAGKTLEQVTAAKPTADLDAKWGQGFIKPDPWVSILYKDLSRPAGR